MAAALNCDVEPNVGCGTCSSCARIMRQRHPDVHHVVPEGRFILVDVIREQVVPEAARSPFEGHRKIFVIEEAERMNEPAQNALLKTLEEPQPDTVFCLISDRADELLPTVRSRCRIIHLDPVSEARVVELLQDDGVPDETALLAARLAGGDYERARALAEDDHARARRGFWLGIPARLESSSAALEAAAEILAEARESVKELEGEHKDQVAELSEAIGEGRGTAAARTALSQRHKRELRRREEETLGEALETLASFYRDVVALRRGAAESLLNLDRVETLERWASSTASDVRLLGAAAGCIATRTTFQMNANPLLQLEAVLLEIARTVPAPGRVPEPA
jgi:DNA polymerase-3 subunit delta'